MIQITNSAIHTFPCSMRSPQVTAFASGIQVVVRSIENVVARIYYFRKSTAEQSNRIVYFYDHTPCVPYEFDSCWDLRTQIYLSADFIQSEYRRDGLEQLLYEHYIFDLAVAVRGREQTAYAQCLLKTSSFSRPADQDAVAGLVRQSLPLSQADFPRLCIDVIASRRISHRDWMEWQSDGAFAIAVNRNGREVGCLHAEDLLLMLNQQAVHVV